MAYSFVNINTFELEAPTDMFTLTVAGWADDELPTGFVALTMLDSKGRIEAAIRADVSVFNPIGVDVETLKVFSKFAACIVAGMAGVTTTELYKRYDESREESPNLQARERCIDVISRVVGTNDWVNLGMGMIATCVATAALT